MVTKVETAHKHKVILQHPDALHASDIRTPDDLRDLALTLGAPPSIVNHLHSWVMLTMDDSVDGRARLCMSIMKKEALEALGYLADSTPSPIQRLVPSNKSSDPIDLLTDDELELLTRPDVAKDVAQEPDKEPILDLSGIDFGDPEPKKAKKPAAKKPNPTIIYW